MHPLYYFLVFEYDNYNTVTCSKGDVLCLITFCNVHKCQVCGNVFPSLQPQGIPIREKGCRMVNVTTSYTDTCVHQSNVNTITQHVHVASWCSLQLVSCGDHRIRLIFCWSSMGQTRLVKVAYFVFLKYHSNEEF